MDKAPQASPELTDQDRAAGDAFARLVAVMRRLRAPGGCPWDREQTLATLKPFLLEETYEVLDAIDRQDRAALCEELGDLILQPVFQAEIASTDGHFNITDSLNAIVEKLIRRHPHVFGTVEAATASDVLRNWEQIKREERAQKNENAPPDGEPSILDSLPRALPSLAEAQRITSRAAKVGFDWPGITEVLDKLREEILELEEARQTGDASRVEEEFGDLLFVMANLARFLKVDAEQALRGTNRKFRERFAFVENRMREQNKELGASTLEEMEMLWLEAKQAL
ncbi:MAG: nucleoside triphosphate pyrophosphohydrolase [Bryobacterales bacterium]|nr:nucleoside triphosphate pyrophosphohydrolase [Bryobacterales bacterium]